MSQKLYKEYNGYFFRYKLPLSFSASPKENEKGEKKEMGGPQLSNFS